MRYLNITVGIFLFVFQACNGQVQEKSKLIGGPCEGCEAVFEYGDMKFNSVDTLPAFHEYEPRLKVTGKIFQSDGVTPAENIILYVYHTNPEGKYPKIGNEEGWAKRHGFIRSWIKTDKEGNYTFFTHMPGSYGSNSAHIHATILEPDGKYYYIDEYHFKSDSLLTKKHSFQERGGDGVVNMKEIKPGFYLVKRDIILGKNIPGYK